MLVPEHAVHELRISSTVIGSPIGWFADAAQPFTAEQIHNAQAIAAAAGLSIETRNDEPTSSTIVNWATVFGIAIALCILAMSVGLIRSETANDLRALAATGASSYTRRTLTAATAGALGFRGAVLGTLAAYIGIIGWLRGHSVNGGIAALGNVPVANLLVILIGLPLLRLQLAGRLPAASHRASPVNRLSDSSYSAGLPVVPARDSEHSCRRSNFGWATPRPAAVLRSGRSRTGRTVVSR
jgi:putative ABC transport system permease protein